jgi:SAM-dependent methyltransferase
MGAPMTDITEWVLANTNTALRSIEDVKYAAADLLAHGSPLHPDYNKNWDNCLAIYHTCMCADNNDPILDAGAGDESAYLPGLKKLGFRNLVGINLDRHDDFTANIASGIRYGYGDITSTIFPNNTFQFISCLSVIEHGVDVASFMAEMARILRPGGHLFVSFDFWEKALDTTGLITHGAPIHIFSNQDVWELACLADANGLTMDRESINLKCDEKIIAWAGLEYTFMNLLFRKRP